MMNRHHPYGTAYEGSRKGGSPPDSGSDRRSRFSDRGGSYGGRGRGRGGGPASSSYSTGGGYEAAPTAAYEGDSYNQWNGSQDPYYSQSAGYGGSGYSMPYSGSADGYDQSSYNAYEGALAALIESDCEKIGAFAVFYASWLILRK